MDLIVSVLEFSYLLLRKLSSNLHEMSKPNFL